MRSLSATDAAASVRHILLLKPSSLGDIVHTLPAVSALRAHHPQARITWMVNPEWAPLLEDNPDINDTMIFPRADFRGMAGWIRFYRWRAGVGQQMAPDLILDFQGLLRSALVARVFREATVYGLSDAREGARFFQTKTVPVVRNQHAVDRYLALASAVGGVPQGVLKFPLPQGCEPRVTLPEVPWILLHPFSRGHGKSFSSDAVDAFCREVGMPVLVVGRGDVAGTLPPLAINLLNKTTLHELIWLLRQATFVVSVDSGPMHVAAALTDKLLGIHAWSDPCRVGPYRQGAYVWKGGGFFAARDPASSTAGNHLPTPSEAACMARWVRQQIS